jgi:histidine ammonia-lyase
LRHLKRSYGYIRSAAPAVLLALVAFGQAAAIPYRAINPPPSVVANDPITLTGHDLTVEQVVAIARYGQAVEVSPEAAEHQDEAHGLLLEAAAEGVPVAGFNRAADNSGAPLFDGDPAGPEIAAMLQQKQIAAFQGSDGAARAGTEIADEEVIRAMMAVRANTLTYAPASAPVTKMVLDFLNNRITPIASTANPLGGVAAAMVGKGDAYYHGVRMPAAQALSQAGLMPLTPVDDDYNALTRTEAYAVGRAALLVADGRHMLEWSDLIYAMDLDGMNAGIAPLSLPARENRPLKWTDWDAARVLDMLKGSYLLTEDGPAQHSSPTTLDLSPARQGAAWRAWGNLRDVLLVALNSSDQALAVRPGLSPRESQELASPQMLKYFVKGGRNNGGKRGFIVPTLNGAPYPLANDVAGFTEAVVSTHNWGLVEPPVVEEGPVPLEQAYQELTAAFIKLAADLREAAKMMDQRLAENTGRTFGAAPTAAWTAFRTVVPVQTNDSTAQLAAEQFILNNKPATFYSKGEPPPGSDDPIPLAQEKIDR